jgi:hypothetical protein
MNGDRKVQHINGNPIKSPAICSFYEAVSVGESHNSVMMVSEKEINNNTDT